MYGVTAVERENLRTRGIRTTTISPSLALRLYGPIHSIGLDRYIQTSLPAGSFRNSVA